MAVTLTERFSSRAGDRTSLELVYTATGSTDDTAVRTAVVSAAPATHDGLVRDDASVRVEPLGNSLWLASISYVRPEAAAPDTTDVEFSFDTSGGTQHITASLAEIDRVPPAAPDSKQLIGGDGEGVDVGVRQMEFTVTAWFDPASVSGSFITNLFQSTYTVNDDTYGIVGSYQGADVTLTFAAGELLFRGFRDGGERDGKVGITYIFSASQGWTSVDIGDILAVTKKGWEYADVRYKETIDGKRVKVPEAVYIHQVYPEVDFAAELGIGF
jgi:hypothetical protein